jgi:large subunit ribosomal protein L13
MERETHTIDAENKILGRLATEIAVLLRGKEKPSYFPYKDEGGLVVIKNIKKIKVTGKKYEDKMYYHYSGFPGGLKGISYKQLFERDPGEVLKRAVYGMLPKNKLRDIQIKRLKFE